MRNNRFVKPHDLIWHPKSMEPRDLLKQDKADPPKLPQPLKFKYSQVSRKALLSYNDHRSSITGIRSFK